MPGGSGGFADRALYAVPQWAMGVIGTCLGMAVAFFIVVKLGGLDAAMQRIANAYATSIEASITKPIERLELLADKYEGHERRIVAIEDWVCVHGKDGGTTFCK